jgi:hypothetical protein
VRIRIPATVAVRIGVIAEEDAAIGADADRVERDAAAFDLLGVIGAAHIAACRGEERGEDDEEERATSRR